MTNLRSTLLRIAAQEDVNFLLTNRIPRRLATRFMGWFSRIKNPLICRTSIAVWRLFADLDLTDAQTTDFRSLHDCFTRRLRPGARVIDPAEGWLVSPCDAIVGAHGTAEDGMALQIKGSPYRLDELFASAGRAAEYGNGSFVTLRLTSAMYHRFHAPHDCVVDSVTHISGDTWNVNPIALKRIERLFCRNERAVLRLRLKDRAEAISLVAVAAILVAGIRLSFLDAPLRAGGERTIRCSVSLPRGAELGWFEHGSTIILFAPPGCRLREDVTEGARVRAGQKLIRLPIRDTGAGRAKA